MTLPIILGKQLLAQYPDLLFISDLRDELVRMLPYYDPISWDAAVVMARDCGCEAIRSELERYVKQYSRLECG